MSVLRGGRSWGPYHFVMPMLLLELLFVGVPLCFGISYSLRSARFFQAGAWIGWDNYLAVVTSASFMNSLIVTVVFTIASLVITFGVGLGLALYLERDTRFTVFIRAVVLVPYVISMMIGSMLLKWMLSEDSGLVTAIMSPLGGMEGTLLSNPTGAMSALVANAVWRDSAMAMLLLLAGLKSIPQQLYVAARIDGANGLFIFRRITLPLLRIPILITLIRLLLHFMSIFTYPLILTGGGPGNATQTLVMQSYALGFKDFNLGQANALAMMLLVFNVAVVLLLIRVFQKRGSLT